MEKLPVEFKEKLVGALRSGKYEQGKRFLYDESKNTFCCIGVGCVVAGIEKRVIRYDKYAYRGMEKYSPLPEQILGMAGSNPTVRILAEMNDSGKSFDEIASYIEINL